MSISADAVAKFLRSRKRRLTTAISELSGGGPEPSVSGAIKFTGTDSFTLKSTSNGVKIWDGTLEYSSDNSTWTTWDGTEISSVDNILYLRGTGNSKIYNSSYIASFKLPSTGTITCEGNIECLLDYASVLNNVHPVMANNCFQHLFIDCTTLITAPELPATDLSDSCYYDMFKGCTALTTAPELPATTLQASCYRGMFRGCSALTTAPELPATTLAASCYREMFYDCTALTTVSKLPATKAITFCYAQMFYNCISLTTIPKLNFTGTAASSCCLRMFNEATGIKVSKTQDTVYTNAWPILLTTTATNWSSNMLANTGGSFTGAPAVNTTYYTSNTVIS